LEEQAHAGVLSSGGSRIKVARSLPMTCSVCHKLFGEGASIGPDLTGAGRDSSDYLIENIVDPSAIVAADYRLAVTQSE
jgi:putative heme-binding domain-containing protein